MSDSEPAGRPHDPAIIRLLDRYGPAWVFLAGASLLVIAVYFAATDKDAAPFVFAGAALAGIGALSRIVESFKAAGVEVKLRDYQLANTLESVADQLIASSDSPSDADGMEREDPAAAAEVLTGVVDALRSDNPVVRPVPVNRHGLQVVAHASEHRVLELERFAGREPRPAGRTEVGDIVSPPRRIEVKSVRGSLPWITLTRAEIEAARTDPDFWVYIVQWDEVGAVPGDVRAVGGDALKAWVATAHEHCSYRLSLRNLEDDSAEHPTLFPAE